MQAHDLFLIASRNRSGHWHAFPGQGHVIDASRSTPLGPCRSATPTGTSSAGWPTCRACRWGGGLAARAVSVLAAYDSAALHILAADGGIGGRGGASRFRRRGRRRRRTGGGGSVHDQGGYLQITRG
uniref:rRNA N-glycosidase n=1 Tax=Setaria viridis TaxID=4556 RepID=A0A4V6D0R8_SETVI|nr:hypothetical protein SEVIR_9G127350v2 [Setaria viridis]